MTRRHGATGTGRLANRMDLPTKLARTPRSARSLWTMADSTTALTPNSERSETAGKYLCGHDCNDNLLTHHRPVFAFSRDLGRVSGGLTSTMFTIGVAQEEAILFNGIEKGQRMPSLWKDYFADEIDLLTFFYRDYGYATQASNKLDNRIAQDSKAAAGQDYLTITSLALRQAFGGLQYTGTKDNVRVFLKEISSNSDIQTVDVIFPAFPIMMYLQPNLIKWTLAPLLEYQKSGRYPNKWAVHDLGRFPVARGYDDGNDEPMPLEECGNMIIMMLAYAQKTGDTQYLKDNWDLMDQWAGYLVEDAKIPAHQLSTDDFAGRLAYV